MDEIQELLEDFLVEAFEMIEEMDQDLVELENSPDDLDLLNKIFRVAHTIKGSGSFLNFDKLTRLTHHMEAVLDKARKGEFTITPEIMDVILESVDAMKGILEYIRDNGEDSAPEIDIEPIVTKLDAIVKGESASQKAENRADENNKPKVVGNINLDEITLENADDIDLDSLEPEELDAVLEHLVELRNKHEESKEDSNEFEAKENTETENTKDDKKEPDTKKDTATNNKVTPVKSKELTKEQKKNAVK